MREKKKKKQQNSHWDMPKHDTTVNNNKNVVDEGGSLEKAHRKLRTCAFPRIWKFVFLHHSFTFLLSLETDSVRNKSPRATFVLLCQKVFTIFWIELKIVEWLRDWIRCSHSHLWLVRFLLLMFRFVLYLNWFEVFVVFSWINTAFFLYFRCLMKHLNLMTVSKVLLHDVSVFLSNTLKLQFMEASVSFLIVFFRSTFCEMIRYF